MQLHQKEEIIDAYIDHYKLLLQRKATPFMPFKFICSRRQNPITATKTFELYIPNLN